MRQCITRAFNCSGVLCNVQARPPSAGPLPSYNKTFRRQLISRFCFLLFCTQYVARNGKNFLMGLSAREGANQLFNFLKPTHSLFSFFTKLCDAYSEVLRPPKGYKDKLQRDAEDRAAVLERCALARFAHCRGLRCCVMIVAVL